MLTIRFSSLLFGVLWPIRSRYGVSIVNIYYYYYNMSQQNINILSIKANKKKINVNLPLY